MTDLFMAGFECSSQRRRDGVRLDLTAATGHFDHAAADYRHCVALGIHRMRDGLRWHLIGADKGRYDWSSWASMVEAADEAGVRVYWDLFHYGFPDWTGPLSDDFAEEFADFGACAAEEHFRLTGRPLDYCAFNELSFFAWAVHQNYFPVPDCEADSPLKTSIVRAAIAACRSIAATGIGGEHIWAEPLINVAPADGSADAQARAYRHTEAQFEAFDMIAGYRDPHLGGHPSLLGTIGVNVYPNGQWVDGASTIPLGHHAHVALSDQLVELWRRYGRPVMISETGSEGHGRAPWLHYVCAEARAAMAQGVPLRGICLYPVTAYPGWDDNRHCDAGLFSFPDTHGDRQADPLLAAEIERQAALFDAIEAPPVDPPIFAFSPR